MTRPGFDPAEIRAVVFDVVGTTLDDGGAGSSVVAQAYVDVFEEEGIAIRPADVEPFRGLDKREAVAALLRRWGGPGAAAPETTERLTRSLLARIAERLSGVREIAGTSETFAFLRRRGVRVALASGLPDALVRSIADDMGWTGRGLLDYLTSAEIAGAGRPDPAMVRDVMRHFGLADPRRMLKVGDTVADVEEGRNAGVWTVSVLTGTQSREVLEAAGPDFLLASVADLPALFAAATSHRSYEGG
jgi:phosphonatase-like hydrolase